MRERASNLGGELDFAIGEFGTRLTLSFAPAVQAIQPNQIVSGTRSRQDIKLEGANS